mmetsp:Transcript_5183/g.17426  ORF Transcript_5183/g.17426 Transcript_5183/m.17426 type:complete len:323 (-) Transcript_5183:1643-2611(-)
MAVGGRRHVRVVGILNLRVGEAVADGDALELDRQPLPVLVGAPDPVGDVRDVMPGVRLARHVKVVVREVGVLGEELLEEVVHVVRDAHLVVVIARPVAEARARWLVDKDEVCVLVPAVGVAHGARAVGIHAAGAVLREERELRGAAGPAGEPEHHRRIGGGRTRAERPVEIVFGPGARGQPVVARVLLHVVAEPRAQPVRALLHRCGGHRRRGREEDGEGAQHCNHWPATNADADLRSDRPVRLCRTETRTLHRRNAATLATVSPESESDSATGLTRRLNAARAPRASPDGPPCVQGHGLRQKHEPARGGAPLCRGRERAIS